MSNVSIGILGIIILLILLAMKMWAGPAMAIVGFFGIWIIRGLPNAYNVVGSVPFSFLNNYNLTVVPMFVLLGMVIAETSIGAGLYRMANASIGRFRGGLAMATVVAAGLLGAITGTIVAGSIIMSKIALPEMKKYKYNDGFAAAAVAGGAPLSIIIPPSIVMVMYGLVAEAPIGTLFIAGFVPGIILIFFYVVFIAVLTRINPSLGPAGPKASLKDFLKSLRGVLPMVILFLLIFGSIYGGVCTTTESGAVGAMGAIIIAALQKDITWKKLGKCLVETVKMFGAVSVLLIGVYIFISFISLSGVPYALTRWVAEQGFSQGVFLLMVVALYIVLGMFLPDMEIGRAHV